MRNIVCFGFIGLFVLVGFLQPAAAGPFRAKTMRGDWPTSRAHRDFTLPKGWSQVGVTVEHKSSTGVRGADGSVLPLDGRARWNYGRMSLDLDHGFSKHFHIYLRFPWVRAHFRTVNEQAISTIAFGDAHAGLWIQPWIGKRWAAALRLDLKAPSGLDWPSDSTGQPNQVTGFLTGTGLTNLGLNLHGKIRVADPFAMALHVGYTFKFPAIVGYVVEVGGFGNGRLDAGDSVDVDFSLLVQPHRVVSIQAKLRFSRRGAYRIGAAGPGLKWQDPTTIMDPGYFLDVLGDVTIEPSQHVEVSVLAGYQVLGTDTRTFALLGLEEFSPQPGLDLGLRVRARW